MIQKLIQLGFVKYLVYILFNQIIYILSPK